MMSSGVGAAGRRLGRYHLAEPLGGGPLGEVFRAKVYGVAGFEREFAVKRFHPEFVSDPQIANKLAGAARSYGSLEHPRIARLHEYGVAGGDTFTATELVQGVDTARFISMLPTSEHTLPPGAGVALVSQAARAVGYAHGRGILHLGLCPTNILATPDGDVKLTDFCFLPIRLPSRPGEDLTLRARMPYLAPEQLVGEPTSAATDAYQLGAIAFEILAGRPPFTGSSSPEIARAILAGRPRMPDLPRALVAVLERCLERSPFERYPDARAVADALDAAVRVAQLPGDHRDLATIVRSMVAKMAEVSDGHSSGAVSFPMPAPPMTSPPGASGAGATVPTPARAPLFGADARSPGRAGPGPVPGAAPGPAQPGGLLALDEDPAASQEMGYLDEDQPTKLRPREIGFVNVPDAGQSTSPGLAPPVGAATAPQPPPAPGARSPSSRPATPPRPPQPAPELGEDFVPRGAPLGPAAPGGARPESQPPDGDRTVVGVPGGARNQSPVGMRPRVPRANPRASSNAPPRLKTPPVVHRPPEAVPSPPGALAGMASAGPPGPGVPRESMGTRAESMPLPSPPRSEVMPAATGIPEIDGEAGTPGYAEPGGEFGGEAAIHTDLHTRPGRAPWKWLVAGVLGAAMLAGGGYVAYDLLLSDPSGDAGDGVAVDGDAGLAPVTAGGGTAGRQIADGQAEDGQADAGTAGAVATANQRAAPDASPPLAAPVGGTMEAQDTPEDKLVIRSEPRGAKVYLDGSLQGRTPVALDATADQHSLALVRPGHRLFTAEIDGHGRLDITLEEVTPTGGAGGIKVRCRKKNRYYVFLDGRDSGQLCPTERLGVELGEHVIEIYDPETESRQEFRVDVEQTRRSLRVRVD